MLSFPTSSKSQSVSSYDDRSVFLIIITHASTSKAIKTSENSTLRFRPYAFHSPTRQDTTASHQILRLSLSPTIDQILQLRRAYSHPPQGVVLENRVYRMPSNGLIWIPDDAATLQLFLPIISRTGAARHRGRQATEQALADQFIWTTLFEDTHLITNSYI